MTKSSVLENPHSFRYIITHVFCPFRLPNGDDQCPVDDQSLVATAANAVHKYTKHASQTDKKPWDSISQMLNNLLAIVSSRCLDRSQITSQLASMDVGDILAFMIRAQNAAVIFRKQRNVTIFESFELSPAATDVMTTKGKLICSYPGPAIEIPNDIFDDKDFMPELANFLVHMNDDILQDAVPKTRKAHTTVLETRDTTHPRYITELLTGILRSVGRPAKVTRIGKRVGDDVVWDSSKLPWRRSSLWLLIRVIIQTMLDRTSFGQVTYKEFMLFFMCCLGKEKICGNLPNDLLQFIAAKISRRLQKLGSSAPDWLSRIVLETCTSLRTTLKQRWSEIQASQRLPSPWSPSELNLSRDTKLSLRNSGVYIRKRLANQGIDASGTKFTPRHCRRGGLNDFLSSDATFFEKSYYSEPHVTLYDVEQAVEEGIDGWVEWVTNNDEACAQLQRLANEYSSGALESYEDNAELLSVMLLTVIELWVALDKITIREIPTLGEYSPEIPTSLLKRLLLCKATSLHRLCLAHQYLSRRHSQSHRGSVFFSTPTADSFAVRYYRGSTCLQLLKSRIERAARHDVKKKITELEKANAHHSELQKQADITEHTFIVTEESRSHSGDCRKCAIEQEQVMDIAIHEWPLPAEQLWAEVVVFELDCPVSFNMWRTAIFHFLVDLCSPPFEPHKPDTTLSQYDALQNYFIRHPSSRISLASNAKPFAVTHYRTVDIPTTQNLVCVPNGLRFYGYDSHACIGVLSALCHVNINKYCTYQLQSSPYRALQKYVDMTSYTSNEVMANQVDCHKDLSIHEFIAFGHMRCGNSIQWLNILRELRARSLNFHHPDVHLLVAQAVSQVGQLSDAAWIWHQEIEHPSFCHAILGELDCLLRDVAANWLEASTMDTISLLLRCMLSVSSLDQTILLEVTKLLRIIRSKVFKWVEELSAARLTGNEEFRGFLRDSAAICRSMFDVNPSQIPNLLNSAQDIDILLFCAISIHDHTPSDVSSLSRYSRLLLDQDRRLSLILESFVSDLLQGDSGDDGINFAISRVWADYRPGAKWIPKESPNSRWFSCKTSQTTSQCSQVVGLNLLDGSLLVDGKPLGRLPTRIVKNSLYTLIFGEQVLDVIPSDLLGMEFSTRGTISNHQVYFSLRSFSSHLVIRAKRKESAIEDSEIMELIPQKKFQGDIPAVLIEGHAHWLTLSTSVIEIRPLDKIWEASQENWRIDCTPGLYCMHKGLETLIDISSPSWAMVSKILKPLDTSSNLIVSLSSNDSDQRTQLSVVLPRYGLSFYVDDDGDLQSRDMRDMVYDENQCIGALFGLVNQLVLRPKIKHVTSVELIPRQVLIPEGNISFQEVRHHVRVEANTRRSALSRVTFQTYKVDTDMGCLTTVGLTSRLYCVYLHALTSGCGTDPLTGRSGTEEALSLLRSAGCWSIMKFSSRDAKLLGLIASLCPPRTWYPTHLKSMQKVQWLDLPTNSQHHELYVVADAIKKHYQRLQSFHEIGSNDLFQEFPSREVYLLKRSALQATYLLPSEFSGKPDEDYCDVRYRARYTVELTYDSGEHRAYTAATTVYHRAPSEIIIENLPGLVKSWSKSMSRNASLSLQYDRLWLDPDFPMIWLQAYDLLRRDDDKKWSQILFSLPAMAYASQELSFLVPIFVVFASHPQFRSEDPPHYNSYDIILGHRPSKSTLWGHISESAVPFEDSPENFKCAKHDGDNHGNMRQRLEMYHVRVKSDTNTALDQWLGAWPCETPPACSLKDNLYHVASLNFYVQRHFAACYHNLKLKEHLTRVQDILRGAPVSKIEYPPYIFWPAQSLRSSIPWMITVDQLFSRPVPTLREPQKFPVDAIQETASITLPCDPGRLRELIDVAETKAVNSFQRQYISTLRSSAECFRGETSLVSPGRQMEFLDIEMLIEHYTWCKANYVEGLHQVQRHLGPSGWNEEALEQSGQWPRMSPCALLQCLVSNSPIRLSNDWRQCIIRLALLLLELQRARRLLRLFLDKNHEELYTELQNEGCNGWNAEAHPDWLLVQLQGNFFARCIQVEVANEMILPRSGDNTVMQLNMGEGKSSIIVPMVVVELANGNQLIRVVVPKALTVQMFYLLVERLGRLTNRCIYFLPFSRSLKVDHRRATALHGLMEECMQKRGVMVVQPEHVLSLKLVSVENQLPDMEKTRAQFPLLELQRWLHSYSCDILDESDEVLHVQYQLVHTIGPQRHVEASPERWTTIQHILSLVKKHIPFLREFWPLGVEYERGSPGSFSHLRVLEVDTAGQELIFCLTQDIMEGCLPNFNLGQLHPNLRDAIQAFVSCENVPPEKVETVKRYSQESHLWGGLLLLRGLLATGVLLFAFGERRWRVDYGLALTRTMLAVPYRAKDVPAQRAEFGHPDVAIILTCLSYYYGGLNEEQLRCSFDILLQQDDPSADYIWKKQKWL